MKKLMGVITAMTTPFKVSGEIDYQAVEEQVEFLIAKGVNCLYPTGTTGEMYLLNLEERKKLAETIINKVNKRVTVYIHVGAMVVEDTIALAQHAQRSGADGIGVVTPSYFTVKDAAIVEYYKKICSAVSKEFPVYAYAIPQLAHNDISVEVMRTIYHECSNMVGIKYSFPDFRRLMAYINIDKDISVVFGADDMFYPALCAGATGVVSGCSGPFPEPFVDIYKCFKAGDMQSAQKAQARANEIVFMMGAGADMSVFKNILTLRGVVGGHMRAPLMDLSVIEVKALAEKIKKYL